ncbi:cytochrome P450 [Kitasatospora sp. NPDC054939]
MTEPSLLQQMTDYANRHDPYPLYARLRESPVHHDETGPYVVGGYYALRSLLHDPRVSSEVRHRSATDEALPGEDGGAGDGMLPPSFLRLDPPEHDRLRALTNRPFGPPHSPRRVDGMRGELHTIVTGLIDGLEDGEGSGDGTVDLVERFSYPFPVTVICRLLGIPRADEAQFHDWADALVASLDPQPGQDTTERDRGVQQARMELGLYLNNLIEERRRDPGDDLLSHLASGRGVETPMTPMEVLAHAALLLIAGHETTVNLITNGMLTLLRHPEILERLRADARLAVPLVEELLRYEPPVQMLPNRTPIADIEVGGVTIPKGSSLYLVVAAGNRDPERFADPDRFDPDRPDIQHLGLGSGIHSCFGAPLARLEAQLALAELARRLERPSLVDDPPPYRQNAVLRGPRHLRLTIDGVRA